MSYEQRPYQTHGAQNQSYQVGTFPPYSSAENFPQAQPCVTASSVFYSSGEERQLPLVLTGHAVQYSNTDYQYQPVAWNGDHHRAATEHAAYSVYEVSFCPIRFCPCLTDRLVSQSLPCHPLVILIICKFTYVCFIKASDI